jgi:hypothetical protein
MISHLTNIVRTNISKNRPNVRIRINKLAFPIPATVHPKLNFSLSTLHPVITHPTLCTNGPVVFPCTAVFPATSTELDVWLTFTATGWVGSPMKSWLLSER